MRSPYAGRATDTWLGISRKLQKKFILSPDDLITTVHQAWSSVFRSRIGRTKLRIGCELFPQPQIMGIFLHELIPVELEAAFPGIWRCGHAHDEQDAVCITRSGHSFEIKTPSSREGIFGNRSYAQEGTGRKKAHQGYFLAVNFESFKVAAPRQPSVTLIRFGWLDSTDWIAQKAATGQRARLTKEAKAFKLLRIWSRE